VAEATQVANSKSANKIVGEYFKDLENIKQTETKPITSVGNVFITMLSFKAIARSYCLFKIGLTQPRVLYNYFPCGSRGSRLEGLKSQISTN
jgi:hypothetical protein